MTPRFTLLLNEVIFMHQLWVKSSRLILSQAVDVNCPSVFILTSWSDISFVVLFGACIEGVVLRDK